MLDELIEAVRLAAKERMEAVAQEEVVRETLKRAEHRAAEAYRNFGEAQRKLVAHIASGATE